MFKKITLKNGLRIILVPQKSSQTVTILVLVGTGSKYEKKDISGISHFLEHMFFKGTKERPSPLDVAQTLDGVGGMYNAFTSQEYTGYFAKVASGHFNLALDWVSDIFLNSTLPEKEIEKEKGVIIEEINMNYDNPMSYIQTLWLRLLYGDQPAGWDIAGTKEVVSKMTRERLLNYRKRQYVAEKTVVAVAGNFNEKTAERALKRCFSRTKTGRPMKKPEVVEKQNSPNVLVHFRQTDQSHLCLGVRAFNLFHPKRYAQEVLAVILGGMMSSRLFQKIRTELGIAYYINTVSEVDPDTGALFTQAGLDNKNLEKGILAILDEYKRISQEKVPPRELKRAKEYIKGKTSLSLESSDARASFYAGQELLENRILTPEQIFKKIDRISQEDILELASEIFRPEKLNLALIGPFKNKEKFQKLLKRL
ncbi:insulinase family protein [bacterium]|nr:insulinase family protein [bacterium]